MLDIPGCLSNHAELHGIATAWCNSNIVFILRAWSLVCWARAHWLNNIMQLPTIHYVGGTKYNLHNIIIHLAMSTRGDPAYFLLH